MKNLIKLGLIGALLFGASYAGSQFLLVKKPVAKDETATTDDPQNPTANSPVKEAGFSVAVEEKSKTQPEAAREHVDSMPVSLQTEQPISIEAVLQLSDSIRKKEAQLNEREKLVLRDEQRVKMMFDDVDREQKELFAMGDSIDARIIAARELLAKIQEERAGLSTSKSEISKASGGKPGTAAGNNGVDERVAQAKSWFGTLEPEQAAEYLKEFANNGDVSFAAQLLNSLDKRQLPKVLAAIGDTSLGKQLFDALPKGQ